MKITPFQTEHFFAKYEFNTPYQLCNSDCDTVTIGELLQMAGSSIEEFQAVSLGYTESQGKLTLRQMIAECYRTVDAGQVVELNAPIEGIYLAARAILNPGDKVVVLTPAYDALVNLFAHIVGEENVLKWEFAPIEDDWCLDIKQFESYLEESPTLLVGNFPHNPTGYVPSLDQWKRIIDLVEQNDMRLFCDEMYTGLWNEGTPPIPSAVDMTDKAIVLSGLSKTYGLPGLRSGWLVVKDEELRADILNWKFYTTICPPSPVEFLTAAALTVQDDLRKRSLAQIKVNLALAEEFISCWPNLFVWRCPKGGSTALVEMKVPSVSAFAEQMAEEVGVLIQPAVTLGASDKFFRLGLGRIGFAEALVHFSLYIDKKFGKARQL